MSGIIAAHFVDSGAGGGVTDSFNRADDASSLGTADTGQTWNALAGTWGIDTNRARKYSAAGQSFAVVSTTASDCTVAATIGVASTSGGGVAFRVADVNNLWFVECDAGQTLLYKVQGGGYAQIITGMPTFAAGDVMSVVLSGTSITIQKNGTTIGSTTSTFNQTATSHGLRDYGGVIRLDDFSVT